jgi:parallel beta-helix repeat protein
MTNRIVIDKPVTVQSVNGPSQTIIVGQGVGEGGTNNGDGAIRCAFVGPNAVLSGFTLTNGYTITKESFSVDTGSGGGASCDATGVLTNCILTGNMATMGGGAYSGKLNNCILSNNWGYNGGGANASTLNNCLSISNSSPFGAGAYSSKLNSCTLVGNFASAEGGGAMFGTLNNCNLIGNSAVYNGGGTYGLDGFIQIRLTNCALINNSAQWGGGAFNGILVNCTLSGNSASNNGGGVFASAFTNCTLIGCILSNNLAAESGGGAYSARLFNCILNGNTANHQGGAGYSNIFDNCTLTGNSAGSNGGGAYSSILNNCVLTRNLSERGGGAATCTLNNCTVTDNSASASGGVDGSTLTNCIVSFNTASADPNYNNSTFAYSCATPLPSGPGNIDTDPLFMNTNSWANLHLLSNSPCINAGDNASLTNANDLDGLPRIAFGTVDMGAYEFQGSFRFVNASNPTPRLPYNTWETAATRIQDAIDTTQPGDFVLVTNGVYATGGRAVVGAMTNRVAIDKAITVQSVNGPNSTLIVGQGAGGMGTNYGDGAIRCAYLGTNAILSGFTLTNGHTRLTADSPDQQSGGGTWCAEGAILTNCILTGNTAFARGGGVCYGTLNNCVLSRNSVYSSGGGAYSSTLNNCVLALNSATFWGGGADSCDLINCAVVGNSAMFGGGTCYGNMINSILYYNSAQGVHSNYIDGSFAYCCTAPMVAGVGNIDTPPLFINTNDWANLRLKPGSPCINAGNNAYVINSTDFDGNPRVVFDVVDMGMYEFDGAARYVSFGNPTPAAPYHSWETAATNIQDAIDIASPGDTVYVYKGVYDTGGRAMVGAMTNRVTIDKPITVQSASSPSQTIIVGQGVGTDGTNNGDGAIRCAYVGAGAILSGFTLTNGHTRINGDALKEQSGGGAWCETNGALVNCLLTGNTAKGRGGAAYLGFLTNCIITGNLASSGGGSATATLVNSLITANNANSYGGGVYNGTLYNCTIAGNASGTFGGGVYGATLTNSIAYYNNSSINPNYSSSTIAWSCVTPLPSGPGNTTNAPLFQNTNQWSNLRLQFNSPCVNSGNTTFAVGINDLDSHPRLFGATVDMGAYENQGIDMGEYMIWLQRYGLPTDGSANEIDSDLDGLNNYQEWRTGTNPTNAASVLRLTQLATNAITLQWPSVTGIRYTLQRSTNLTTPFQPLITNIIGTSAPITYTDTNPPTQVPLFYRLGVGD